MNQSSVTLEVYSKMQLLARYISSHILGYTIYKPKIGVIKLLINIYKIHNSIEILAESELMKAICKELGNVKGDETLNVKADMYNAYRLIKDEWKIIETFTS